MTGPRGSLRAAALLLLGAAGCASGGQGEAIATTVLASARGERYLITTRTDRPNLFLVVHDGPGRPDPAVMAELVQRRRNCAYLERVETAEDSRSALFRGAFCRGSDFWR